MSDNNNGGYVAPNIRGRVVSVGAEEVVGQSFRKRRVVVETGFKYPNPIQVSFTRDNVAKLDGVNPGDDVTIRYRLDGREWNGPNGVRYFVDVTGIDIDVHGAAHRKPAAVATSVNAVDAWKAAHPDKPLSDRANVEEFQRLCVETCPKIAEYAKGRGAKFSECAQPSDWQAIIDRINGVKAEPETDEPNDDDLPF